MFIVIDKTLRPSLIANELLKNDKVTLVKAIKVLTGLGLKESKELHDRLPSAIKLDKDLSAIRREEVLKEIKHIVRCNYFEDDKFEEAEKLVQKWAEE